MNTLYESNVSHLISIITRIIVLMFPPDRNESNCNITIKLTSEMRFTSVSSPGFPQPYPDNQDCTTSVEVARGYQIEVEFEELMLENEST